MVTQKKIHITSSNIMAGDLTTGEILSSISDKNPFPTTSLQLEFLISDLDKAEIYMEYMKRGLITIH